jgi:hypothetical protein
MLELEVLSFGSSLFRIILRQCISKTECELSYILLRETEPYTENSHPNLQSPTRKTGRTLESDWQHTSTKKGLASHQYRD